MLTKTYFVYILASDRYGTLYTGVTSDLVRRVHEHRGGDMEGFTRRYGIKRLVWFDSGNDVAEVIRREKQIKSWHRQWKINLIETTNPEWNNLYPLVARLN